MQAPPDHFEEPQLTTSLCGPNETLLGQQDVAVQHLLLRDTNLGGQFSYGNNSTLVSVLAVNSKRKSVPTQPPQMFLVELRNPSAETFPHRNQCCLVELGDCLVGEAIQQLEKLAAEVFGCVRGAHTPGLVHVVLPEALARQVLLTNLKIAKSFVRRIARY
jgi:hypothetical protein